MNKRQIIEIFLSIAVLILAITQLLSTIEMKDMEKEIDKLKINNELYNYNLSELKEFESEDVNKDGVVDISDLAIVKSRILKGDNK